MEATKATINTIINSQALVEIPFFQRPYVWGKELWSRLLNDIVYVASNKNIFHFIGSVILKEVAEDHIFSSGSTQKVRILVDGQQRVTTLLILLKVIALKFNKGDLFDDKFYDMDNNLLFTQGQNDQDAFEEVMGMTEAVEIDNSDKKSRVIEAFNYFLNNLDRSGLRIENGRHFTYIMEHIQFVSISLNANENEQQIFDTLNSLGVNLTTSELLKNYFFNRDTIDLYRSKWAKVFERDKESREYWFGLVERGFVKRAMIDIFFEAYFKLFVHSDKYNISKEDKLKYERTDNLFLSIQSFISKYCYGDKDVLLDRIHEYADCFRKSFRPSLCDESILSDSALHRLNVVMFGLGHTTLIPYVLFVAKNVNDYQEQDKIYHVLESFVMRRIVTIASTKGYSSLISSLLLNKILTAAQLMDRLRSGRDAWIPNDESLEMAIRDFNRTNVQSKAILYLIENSLHNYLSATQLLGFNHYSLEHLMPKKWRNRWPECDSDNEKYNRDQLLLTLGNLAIIPQALNVSIRDSDWRTKKEGNGKKPGLRLCAAGLITLDDVLTKDEWNENEILHRSYWLYEQAVKIWEI